MLRSLLRNLTGYGMMTTKFVIIFVALGLLKWERGLKAKLYINDLKTGKTPPKMEQLWVYAALFCLQNGIRPGDLEVITRLYFQDDVVEENPSTEDLAQISDRIKTVDKIAQEEDDTY